MNTQVTLFDDTVEITLPKNYHLLDRTSSSTETESEERGQSAILLLANLAGAQKVPAPAIEEKSFCFTNDNQAYIVGITVDRGRETDELNNRLDEYYRSIARSLPLVANAQIAVRNRQKKMNSPSE